MVSTAGARLSTASSGKARGRASKSRGRATLIRKKGIGRFRLSCAPDSPAAYAGPVADLDDWLPRYDHREYHELRLDRPPEEALDAALAAAAEPDGIVGALFRLRGLDARGKSLEQLFSPPWAEQLERTGTSFVARVNRATRLEIVFDLRARLSNGGSVLSTETRVFGGGARFRIYWLVIRPFSGLIRRRWLIAAAKRAAAPAP
jgi:hypothetical protein